MKYQRDLNYFILAKTGKFVYGKDMNIRYGVMEPEGQIAGDILYIHGFADRLDNHVPLFEEFNRRGFRVISFDLPGHGENQGYPNSMDGWTFTDLTELATAVEKHVVRTTGKKPPRIFLSGWSTGGLIALRLGQGLSLNNLSRYPTGMILYAPGVAVKGAFDIADKSTGYMWGWIGRVTQESLTHHPNPPHNGPIRPISPVTHIQFGLRLLHNAKVARNTGLFDTLPTLIFSAGETEDLYADTPRLVSWVRDQQARGKMAFLVECYRGRHELDNEAEPMGETVRSISGDFLSLSLEKEHSVYWNFQVSKPCRFDVSK